MRTFTSTSLLHPLLLGRQNHIDNRPRVGDFNPVIQTLYNLYDDDRLPYLHTKHLYNL